MKKNVSLILKLVAPVALMIVIFACKSAPPPASVPEPPPPASAPESSPPKASDTPPPDARVDRERALAARDKAKSIKADVADKEEFNAAQKVFDEGEALTASASPGAAEKYKDAEGRFLKAYDNAYAKREEARRQLDLARNAIKTAEDDAAAAEAELQAASGTEGGEG